MNEKLNKNQKRHMDDIRMKTCFGILQSLVEKHKFDIYIDLAKLCRDKNKMISGTIYDMLLDINYSVSKGNYDLFKKLTVKYIDKLNVYNFLIGVRDITCRYELDSPVFLMLVWVTNMIISMVVSHPIAGINNKKGEIYIDEISPSVVDILICCDLYQGILFKQINSYNISDKDLRFAHAMFTFAYSEETTKSFTKYVETMADGLDISKIEAIKQIGFHLINVSAMDQIAWLFCTKYHRVDMMSASCWALESESRGVVESVPILTDTIFSDTNLFLKRNRILRENGVRIVMNGELEDITAIEVHELHDFESDVHCLFVKVTYDDYVNRYIQVNLKEPLKGSWLTFEKEASVIIFLMYWLGLKDIILEALQNLKSCKSWKEMYTEDVDDFIKYYVEWFNYTEEMVNKSDLRYEDPESWNYTGSTAFNKKKRHTIKYDGEYEYVIQSIGTYVRKLPAGHNASEEKRALAEKYLIDLPTGYTLVDGFTRKQKVKVTKGL